MTNGNARNVQIFCNDAWLKDTNNGQPSPKGNVGQAKKFSQHSLTRISGIGSNWYWDGRPEGSTMSWLENFNLCRDNPETNAFTYPQLLAHQTSQSYSPLTFCQGRLSNWIADWNQGKNLTTEAQKVHPDSAHITNFYWIISTTYLHELTHCGVMLGLANILSKHRKRHLLRSLSTDCSSSIGDVKCDNGQTAYGWSCLTELGKSNGDAAVNNAGKVMNSLVDPKKANLIATM